MSAAMDSGTSKIRIFVRLLEEGTEVFRPTNATNLGNGLFKILPTPNYDAKDELWEFPPGSVVRGENRLDDSGEYFVAIKP